MTRIAEKQRLWDAIPRVPDLRCFWQLLLQCWATSQSHDPKTTIRTFQRVRVMIETATVARRQKNLTEPKRLHHFPLRMGGLGLPSAGRCTRAACWASWADAIPMNSQRNPTVANSVVQNLSGAAAPEEDCLEQFHECAQTLDREGSRWRPTCSELRTRIRTPDDLVDGKRLTLVFFRH